MTERDNGVESNRPNLGRRGMLKSPGEFTYFCTIHPMMVGKIVVKPAGSSS